MKKKIDTKIAGLDASVYLAKTFGDTPWLHYGMWEPGERPTMPTLRRAQERYVDKLLSLFPAPPKRVLDIGGGTGEMAAVLHERGYEVEMLTPSEVQVNAARERLGAEVKVHQVKFQDFPTPDAPFDVLLFSESFQYVPLDQSLPRLRELLGEKGTVIIADCFRSDTYKQGDLVPGAGHSYSRFLAEAAANRFEIVENIDVTEAVAPSMALDQQLYRDLLAPILAQVDQNLRATRPVLRWFAHTGYRLFTKPEARFKMRERLKADYRSPENFKRANTYRFLVLSPG